MAPLDLPDVHVRGLERIEQAEKVVGLCIRTVKPVPVDRPEIDRDGRSFTVPRARMRVRAGVRAVVRAPTVEVRELTFCIGPHRDHKRLENSSVDVALREAADAPIRDPADLVVEDAAVRDGGLSELPGAAGL